MKILITMLLLSAFIIVSCDGGTKKDTDKDLGISDTDVITDQEVTDQDSPVPDDGDVVDEENDLSDMDSDEDVDDEESDEESDEDPLLCEEGDTRIISCGFNDNGDQEQICADGVWKKQGDCDDPDECKYREERNCVDFDSFQRCIEGSWETISLKHEGLEWSCRSPAMKWQKAMDYCENMAGRLPTISELRTLIQNCPATETGGSCGVTDSCLSYGDCWNGSCSGCVWDPGKYSVFWDGYIRLWSSSHVDSANFAWLVFFYYGDVVRSTKTSNDNARCVK
jgi:hypothetical protein